MKQIFIFLLSLLSYNWIFASPIDERKAQTIAEKFYASLIPALLKASPELTLVYKCISDQTTRLKSDKQEPYYYVFNSKNGFVIIAGDDASLPILGYSTESDFDSNKIPQSVSKWLEGYKEQIRYIKENNVESNKTIKNEWFKLENGQLPIPKRGSVSPLIATKWNQNPYFNDKCPFDYTYNELTVTGCPATAMAQIMKFWKYPQKGFGFHSYKHNKYGTLSANFSSTYYDWDKMPNTVTGSNDAVATLMFHCGVACEMNYGVSLKGGSGSYVIQNENHNENSVEYALKSYFGYSTSIKGIERRKYNDADWITILKNELNAGRPIQYAGYGQSGHTFVCDGYDSNNFFHMNWGWGGSCDGYFNLNALNPGTGGTGSGAGTYNSNQQALIGIKPPDASQTYDLEIYDDVVSNKSTISYGEGFTITTDILNDGEIAFAGDFCAGVFDENGVFIDFVETKTNKSLGVNTHYANDISFTTTGLLTMLPGTYKVYIYYRPSGGNWVGIKADFWSPFTDDYTTIKVTNTNDIRLYADMSLTPSDNIYSGQAFSVDLDVANYSSEDFTGSISLMVYSLQGDSVSCIEIKPDVSITSLHHRSSMTFSTDRLLVNPGSYILVALHKWNGYSWHLTGSTDEHINPIKIVVQEPPYKADVYEPNNDVSTSYQFIPLFSDNNTIIKTIGSNIHVGNDYDYYKTTLDAGYNYKIEAKLQDVYSSSDGEVYTLDGLFSYSFDGENWSESYDELLSSSIILSGYNTLYFRVSPYFLGETGTYQLDISISRTEIEQPNLQVSTSSIVLNSISNSSQQFTITSNGNWELISNQTWLTLDKTNGTNNATISVSATENTSKDSRNGIIMVTGNGIVKTITVTQNAEEASRQDEISTGNILIYPNPATNTVTVETIDSGELIASIELIDRAGKTILSKFATTDRTSVVSLGTCPNGIYYLLLTSANGEIITKKLVVKK